MRWSWFNLLLSLVLMTAGRVAHSQSFEIPMRLEAQRGDNLCWAATSAAVVEKMLPLDNDAREILGAPVEQFRLAALGMAGITKPGGGSRGFDTRKSSFEGVLPQCEEDISDCDLPGQPLLFGLTFKLRGSDKSLSPEELKSEIVDFKRPVLMTIIYTSKQDCVTTEAHPTADRSAPTADKHALIIFGYKEVGARKRVKVKIWNPLAPDARKRRSIPPSAQLGTWTNYADYVNPSIYTRCAARNADAYEIKVATRNSVVPIWPMPPSASSAPLNDSYQIKVATKNVVPIPPPASSRPLNKVNFTVARRAFEARKEQLLSQYIADSSTDVAAPARVSFGEPFPIVAPTLDELLEARADPARVLTESTSGLVVPVLQYGKVVDSFLLVNNDGDWKVGGLSSLEVDRVLVELRTKYPAPSGHPDQQSDSFYMVAIPEASAFFAARGLGRNAQLMSVNDGGMSPRPGDKLLGQVITRVEAGIARYRAPKASL